MTTSPGGAIAAGAVLLVLLAACAGQQTPRTPTRPAALVPGVSSTGAAPGTSPRSDDADVILSGLPAGQHWAFSPPAQYHQTTTTASRTYNFSGGTAHDSWLIVTVSSPLTSPNSTSVVVTGHGPDITPTLLNTARHHLTIAPGAQFGPQPGAAASSAGTESR